jgi:hypothetical protein
VNNLPNRNVCWQCGNVLPMRMGPDGQPRAITDSDQHKLRKAEIDALLDQAQTLDLTSGAKPRKSESTSAQPSAWSYAPATSSPAAVPPRPGRWAGFWFRRKRQPEV